MKRKGLRAVAVALTLSLLAGCSPVVENVPHKTTIYTTFYPLYAMTQMLAEGAQDLEIHCLVQPQDDCFRTYQLSDWDYYMLGYSADGLIAAGNGLEGFADQLEAMGQTAIPVIEVMAGLEMAHFDGAIDDEDSHFAGDNPHLYMSVDGASSVVERLSAALMLLDSKNQTLYESNLIKVQKKMDGLRENIQIQTKVCEDVKAAVMHEALFYVASDCGLDITAWCERESGEMLHEDMLSSCLTEFKDEQVELILIEQQAPKALVDELRKAGYAVVQLDVLSTHGESDGAETYFEAILQNIGAVAGACSTLN